MTENQSDLIQILKERGLKVTSQRIAVLQIFYEHKGAHLSVEEIYEMVKKESPEIGLATVYRTVQLLSELEIIDKVNLDEGYVRYEIGMLGGEKSHHHHHLICLRCGGVFAFEEDGMDSLEEHIYHTQGFLVIDHEVKLFGYCLQCQKKKDETV
ncbi:MAG: Fur family transcriptional regulator, ferric uptake regulator [Clostridiales bacterium]|nr:Fur family transcriptional regulator, ferric uptake regulator [Clostridiales bacterium]